MSGVKSTGNGLGEEQAGSGELDWGVGVVGALVGVFLCVIAFTAYNGWGGRHEASAPPPVSSPTPDHLSGVRQAAESRPVKEEVTPTPSPEASPEPSPTSTPTPTPTAPAASPLDSLSDTPVSTSDRGVGTGESRRTIRLNNGTSLEVDDVWRSSVGVWYRRGTVVSQLDPSSIKSIERRAPPPSPIPEQSPTPQ
jgi:hypothetical protein